MSEFEIRPVVMGDLKALYALEQVSFETDRLTQRRMRHWIKAENRSFLVAVREGELLGYALALLLRGTRLARLYSLAVASSARGHGVGHQLMQQTEHECASKGRIYMRLEVAYDNQSAIILYDRLGYRIFGTYHDYYQDHRDALRMQKRIRYVSANLLSHQVPWYQQSTDFTCGPSALMMAMASLEPQLVPNQELELDLWREATTIFMTSGHGGCHPLGLALAAHRRGFKAESWINQSGPLFIEGVRSPHKKVVMETVDRQFREQCEAQGVEVHCAELTQIHIDRWLNEGASVLVLISTYRFDGRKAPHWVTVTAIDDLCLYVHDPDPTEGEQIPFDCQYLPIARQDFDKISSFGRDRLRCAVVVRVADSMSDTAVSKG